MRAINGVKHLCGTLRGLGATRRLAKPSLNKHYSFGYVGGGTAFHGEPRFSDEGTWGVDYSGILFKKQTWLSWLHGNRPSRRDGSYQTDGPHLLHR